MMRMHYNRKGMTAFTSTLLFLFVNLMLFILVQAISMDPDMQDDLTSYGSTSFNSSLQEGESGVPDYDWTDSFFITISNLPWWLNTILFGFESLFLIAVILAWVRGI